jgi:hypothetical protein
MYIQQYPVIVGNKLQTEGRSKYLAIYFVYKVFHVQKSAGLLTFFYEAVE